LDQLASFRPFLSLSAQDRRLATEMAYGVIRNKGRLDFYIRELSGRELRKIDPVIRWVLRLGLYELEFLRTPDRAAVYEAVELTRVVRKASAASFVNAVLRGYLRNRPELPSGSSAAALAVRFSHPEWLVARYLDRFGEDATCGLLERNNSNPLPLVRVNRFKTDIPVFTRLLEQEGIAYEEFASLPDALVIHHPAFAQHPFYQDGYCFFMDAASQEVAHLPDLEGVRTIGDFCAAPGGKAFILAWRCRGKLYLKCLDISRARLLQMRKRAEVQGVPGLSYLLADLTRPAPFQAVFDFVLADVPCSGLGTIRSNPDIRWTIQSSHLSRFQERQVSILRNAFDALAPGGRVFYVTCSTEPEENEQVVERFLESEPRSVLAHPYFRTFPGAHPGDCFFAAEIRHI